jgi:hypothetical protein
MKHQESTATALFSQAVKETRPRIARGVYTPRQNRTGAILKRFKELCSTEGIDPRTGERAAQ